MSDKTEEMLQEVAVVYFSALLKVRAGIISVVALM